MRYRIASTQLFPAWSPDRRLQPLPSLPSLPSFRRWPLLLPLLLLLPPAPLLGPLLPMTICRDPCRYWHLAGPLAVAGILNPAVLAGSEITAATVIAGLGIALAAVALSLVIVPLLGLLLHWLSPTLLLPLPLSACQFWWQTDANC